MKMKVLIPFTDKYTKKQYKKGDIAEVTAKRFNEINKRDKLVEAYDETTAYGDATEGDVTESKDE